MSKSVFHLLSALLMVLSSSSTYASTYSCVNREGNVMRITKPSAKNSFTLKLDDGGVYTCKRSRANGRFSGRVSGGYFQRTLPDGDIMICNQRRCYREHTNDPFTYAGDI